MRLYAIGDIHGQYAELRELLARIDDDRRRFPDEPAKFVFLGDYIDRGPDSARVVACVKDLVEASDDWNRYVAIKGNHEDMLIMANAAPDASAKSMAPYGCDPQTLLSYEAAGIDMVEHMPFLENLPSYHRHGEFVFVHAGLDPDKDLAEHTPDDFLWNRAFNDYDGVFYDNVFVVHGHTPVPRPDLRANQLNIDTGSVWFREFPERYDYGLTAVRIDDRSQFKFFHKPLR